MFSEQDLRDKKDQLSAVHGEMNAILEAGKANGDTLSAEQSAQFAKLDAQCDGIEAEIVQAEKDVALLARHAARTNAVTTPTPRVTSPDSGNEELQIGNVRDAFLDDPNRGFADPSEFLMALMEVPPVGVVEDQRIRSLAVGSDEQSTISDPYGGFLLPKGFSPDLLTRGTEGDPTAGSTTRMPMTTQQLSIPARVDSTHTSSVSGGLRVYRRGETDTSASSRMEFEQVVLNATMLFGLSYASEELLQRSPISFVTLLEAGFADEFASKLLKEKLYGTGAGEYTGVTNAGCTVEQAKESGQTATTIVYENIINMRSRCWGYGNAIWLANHDTLPQLMSMSLTVGDAGSAMWQPSAREDHPDMLLGRPLYFTEFCKTLGTAGDIICGNWSQYLEGILGEGQQAESIHVRFINHERTFKFWQENDGAPWWRAALTPNQSSATLSPFVTLAVRA